MGVHGVVKYGLLQVCTIMRSYHRLQAFCGLLQDMFFELETHRLGRNGICVLECSQILFTWLRKQEGWLLNT